MTGVRRVGGSLVAVLVVAVLAACATIPMSGPVRTAAPQQQQQPQQNDAPVFTPNGPTDNMKPEEVVRGFVQAQSGGQGYAVAKEFLTKEFAASWRPNERVMVHRVPWETKVLPGGESVRLTVQEVGEVNASGVFAPTSAKPSETYRLQQVDGQWRVSSGPNAVVLFDRRFPSVFSNVSLKFFDPSYKRLVPDVRWFPIDSDRASEVVRALLEGPALPLQGVVAPVFPSGTTLAAPVRTSGGVITVSVRVPGGGLDEKSTDRIQQALASALVGSSAGLELVVNGRQASTASPPELDQPSITDPVVVSGGRFGSLTAQGVLREDRTFGPRIAALDPQAVTVSARQRLASVLTGDGQVAVVSRQGDPRLVDTRSDLVPPTLDQSGWTWSVPEDDPDGLTAFDAAGRQVPVGSSLGVSSVESIEVSTDGTRLLWLGQSESGYQAFVAGILRSADGTPIALTTDRYVISIGSSGGITATWLDPSNVAVLTATDGSAESVVQQQLGGISTPLGLVSNARRVVGATGVSDLRVLNGSGQIVRLQSSTGVWSLEFSTSLDVDVLAVQR